MTQYSPVAPLPLLRELLQAGHLGNYLLLLAHDVLKDPHGYNDFVADAFEQMGPLTIIMDNSVIEQGVPVTLAQLMEASSVVEADIVVGPDAVGDYEETKKRFMEQADYIRDDYALMLVPQGETLEDICECIRWMDERFPDDGKRWWGIPRWIANTFGTRAGPITYINNYARGLGDVQIHLLGMSQHLEDDIQCCKTLSVRGMDSANPLVLGYNNIMLNAFGQPQHHERGDYWEQDELSETMLYNVTWLRDVIGG